MDGRNGPVGGRAPFPLESAHGSCGDLFYRPRPSGNIVPEPMAARAVRLDGFGNGHRGLRKGPWGSGEPFLLYPARCFALPLPGIAPWFTRPSDII